MVRSGPEARIRDVRPVSERWKIGNKVFQPMNAMGCDFRTVTFGQEATLAEYRCGRRSYAVTMR